MADLPSELAVAMGDARVSPDLAQPVIQMWELLDDDDRSAFLQLIRRMSDPLERLMFVSVAAPIYLLSRR